MGHLYGQKITPGQTTRWHPVSLEDIGGGEFALKVVGTTGGGGATLGVVKHYNGAGTSVSPTQDTVAFAATTKSIFIENLSTSDSLLVSFDGGTTEFSIPSGESLGVDAAHDSITLSGDGASVPYQILTTE